MAMAVDVIHLDKHLQRPFNQRITKIKPDPTTFTSTVLSSYNPYKLASGALCNEIGCCYSYRLVRGPNHPCRMLFPYNRVS